MKTLTQEQLDSAIALICEYKKNMKNRNREESAAVYVAAYVKHPELATLPTFAELATLEGGPDPYEVSELLNYTNMDGLTVGWHDAHLHDVRFDRCSFRMADMSLCEFRECWFTRCDFEGAHMEGTRFINSPITNSNMKRCRISDASFSTSEPDWPDAVGDEPTIGLRCVDLTMADLSGAEFSNFELLMVDLSLCELSGAKFDESTIKLSDLRRTDLSRVSSTTYNLKLENNYQ